MVGLDALDKKTADDISKAIGRAVMAVTEKFNLNDREVIAVFAETFAKTLAKEATGCEDFFADETNAFLWRVNNYPDRPSRKE